VLIEKEIKSEKLLKLIFYRHRANEIASLYPNNSRQFDRHHHQTSNTSLFYYQQMSASLLALFAIL